MQDVPGELKERGTIRIGKGSGPSIAEGVSKRNRKKAGTPPTKPIRRVSSASEQERKGKSRRGSGQRESRRGREDERRKEGNQRDKTTDPELSVPVEHAVKKMGAGWEFGSNGRHPDEGRREIVSNERSSQKKEKKKGLLTCRCCGSTPTLHARVTRDGEERSVRERKETRRERSPRSRLTSRYPHCQLLLIVNPAANTSQTESRALEVPDLDVSLRFWK